MARREFSTWAMCAAMAAVAGCCGTGHHKSKKCDVCEQVQAPVYYYDPSTPQPVPQGVPQLPPVPGPGPMVAPQPIPDPHLPAVPPPPTGSASLEEPSRIDQMRTATREFFENTNNRLRGMFHRDETTLR